MQNQKMMKQLQQMQTKMAKMQEELETVEVTGTAGGGAITVTANGHQRILSVAIEPEVLEEGAELLADMVLAAVNEALRSAQQLVETKLGGAMGGMQGLGLPGL